MWILLVLVFGCLFGESGWNLFYGEHVRFKDQNLSVLMNEAKMHNFNITVARLATAKEIENYHIYYVEKVFDKSETLIGLNINYRYPNHGSFRVGLNPKDDIVVKMDDILKEIINRSRIYRSFRCNSNTHECYYEVKSCEDTKMSLKPEPFLVKKLFEEAPNKKMVDFPDEYFRRKHCIVSKEITVKKDGTDKPKDNTDKLPSFQTFEIYVDY